MKLMYRGHSYSTTPSGLTIESVASKSVMVTLSYRGHFYGTQLRLPKLPQPIGALSWCYQAN